MNDALINQVHCLEFQEMCARVEDKSVDMVLIDIPYNSIDINPRIWERELGKNGALRQMSRGVADSGFIDIQTLCIECERISKAWIYIFCGMPQISEIVSYFMPKYTTRLCVWEKTNPSPMIGEYIWLSACEYCVVVRKPNGVFNNHCVSSVWRFPSGTRELHPTQKNLDLFEYLIQSSTNKGDLVFDGFAGSGTTALACQRTGRNFICSDFTPEYVDIARKRLQDADYTKPTTIKDGFVQLSLFGN